MRNFGRLGVAALAMSVLWAGCAGQSLTPADPVAAQQSAQGATQSSQMFAAVQPNMYATWSRSLIHTALPSAGCFHASYPSYTWTRIACSTPPNLLYPLPAAHGIRSAAMSAQSVGNGDDYTADVSPKTMSEAIGSFPSVTGVTSVKSVENPEFGCCGENGKNSYTLQLNSYFFATSACGKIKNCEGWEQFVYENPPSGQGQLFIQDWLIPTTESGLNGCPSGKGWEYADGGCVQNSPNSVNIANVKIAKLASLIETGEAASSGDSIYLTVGTDAYGMKNVQSDGITDLSGNWQGAEFNVIGNAGGDIADFNSGSTIQVSLEADTGATAKPSCPADSGTTGESNNLSFKAAPSSPSELEYPSILFTESNVSGGGSASCDTIAGL